MPCTQTSDRSKPVRIRTYLHEKPQKTERDMHKFAPASPHLRAPNRNKPAQIRTPSWKTPQRRTYRRRGVQIRVGLEPTENVPSNLVPSTFLKHFRGQRGCRWYGPSAPPGRHFAIRTLGYKRGFGAGTRYASLGSFLGIVGATGRDQGGTWYGTSAKP